MPFSQLILQNHSEKTGGASRSNQLTKLMLTGKWTPTRSTKPAPLSYHDLYVHARNNGTMEQFCSNMGVTYAKLRYYLSRDWCTCSITEFANRFEQENPDCAIPHTPVVKKELDEAKLYRWLKRGGTAVSFEQKHGHYSGYVQYELGKKYKDRRLSTFIKEYEKCRSVN